MRAFLSCRWPLDPSVMMASLRWEREASGGTSHEFDICFSRSRDWYQHERNICKSPRTGLLKPSLSRTILWATKNNDNNDNNDLEFAP
jgi:hypothetical protein